LRSKTKREIEASVRTTSEPADPVGFFARVTVVGIAIRVAMVVASPRFGYFQDHDDLARWGLQAAEEGVLTLYDHPPKPADLRIPLEGGAWGIGRREMDRLCNYPPLCVYLLGASGGIFKAVSSERLVNTFSSRASIAGWSFVFDILLAWGCASLTAQLSGGRSARRAYAWVLLAPPFWVVSSLWGQVDTWVLAPAVWMVRAMTAGQWGLAGLLYGVTAAIKPQAAAFIPVWGLAIFVTRSAWKPIASLGVAALTLNVLALPFWLHSGAAWWRQSYQANLFEHSKGMTTLMAFNVWYLDCMLTGSVDEAARCLGLTKATWGQLALALALICGFVFVLRRWATDRGAYVLYCLLALLAFVMLPTRVHDRFILLVLPFLIVAAVRWVRPTWLILLIAATGQVTWPQWLSASSADWQFFEKEQREKYAEVLAATPKAERASQPSLDEVLRSARAEYELRNEKTRPIEWAVTLLSLIGTATVVVGVVRLRRAGSNTS